MKAVWYIKVSTKHGSGFHQIQSAETVPELVSRATGVDRGQIVSVKARKVDSSQDATDEWCCTGYICRQMFWPVTLDADTWMLSWTPWSVILWGLWHSETNLWALYEDWDRNRYQMCCKSDQKGQEVILMWPMAMVLNRSTSNFRCSHLDRLVR